MFYTTQHRWNFSGTPFLGIVGHPEHAIAPDRELLLCFHYSTCAERRESRQRRFPKHNPLPNGCTFQYLPLESSAFSSVFSCTFALRQRNSDGLATFRIAGHILVENSPVSGFHKLLISHHKHCPVVLLEKCSFNRSSLSQYSLLYDSTHVQFVVI